MATAKQNCEELREERAASSAKNDTIAKLFHEWGWKVTVYDGAE